MDQNTERRHYLNSPVSARFVRVRPLTWHKRIGMRAAVIGCPHRGDCGVGFFRVNSGSACGESEWAGEGGQGREINFSRRNAHVCQRGDVYKWSEL